ncbi:Acyltransferase family, partial [Aspergillus sclerotialis]
TTPLISHHATSYLDGIRGLAALTVYIQHYSAPFQPGQIGEANRESGKWSFFQYPIIRLFYSGSFAVALFFVISGFALSRKPLRHRYAYHDNTGREISEALLSLSSASFRRGIRIFIPPIVIVLFTMLGTQMHLFDPAYSILPDNLTEKYNVTPPKRLDTFSSQLLDCIYYIAGQLIYPSQWMRTIPGTESANYGFQLWTIPMEFWASLVVFSVLGTLVPVKSRAVRNGGVGLVIIYAFWCSRWEISLFLSGTLLADLDLFLLSLPPTDDGLIISLNTQRPIRKPKPKPKSKLKHILLPLLWTLILLTGLYLGSTPEMNADVTPGFTTLTRLTPHEETWHSLGAVLVILTISRCRLLQKPLSTSFPQYLGRISFGLYLVHVPILMWFGWTATPGLWSIIENDTVF